MEKENKTINLGYILFPTIIVIFNLLSITEILSQTETE